MDRHRETIVLRGTPGETCATAEELVADLSSEDVLWVSEGPRQADAPVTEPRKVRKLLGGSFDAVVLDFHDRLDANLLGQCHGFVWGGGALILRLPPAENPPAGGQERFAVHPYGPDDVGFRFHRHFERALRRADLSGAIRLAPVEAEPRGTAEQAAAAARLTEFLREPGGAMVVVADRGRGKSSAIGMALRHADEDARVAVTAGSPKSVGEVFRFATGEPTPPSTGNIRFVASAELAHGAEEFDVLVVDEAAQLPVPILQRIVSRHADSNKVFATTTHGYEGTGRGFTLRFVDWLAEQGDLRDVLTLDEPIRWAAGDPLERFVFDALLLDAEPASPPDDLDLDSVRHVRLERDELLEDEALLREFFGLLVHAHYRTTPGDLRRILDAPNLSLHALLADGHVVAATMVAEEGGLPADVVDDIYRGRRRVRGHALAETLVSHLGRRDAGTLSMIRSVRIATHPALRRRGFGTRLIQHVHETYEPDLFGTLFGATPGLLKFRRRAGYRLVRVGASRGSRTGEPAAVMVHPVSEEARTLVHELRRELARDLPLQLELLEAGKELVLDPALRDALLADLPPPAELSDRELQETVAVYAFGPRTYEAAATALERFVNDHLERLADLQPQERRLIESRVLERRSWTETAADAQMPGVRAAMRAIRRAIRALVRDARPELEERIGG